MEFNNALYEIKMKWTMPATCFSMPILQNTTKRGSELRLVLNISFTLYRAGWPDNRSIAPVKNSMI
jgi:hypothetical protein